jgi:SET domain-containing protein
MDITKEVINHLKNNIKTEIAVSPIHGVGVFAIKDIKEGEQLFPIWEYETGIYLIPNEALKEIPNSVLILLDKYFINEECGFKVLRLFKGMNFLFHGTSYCNSAYPNIENINIDINGVALRDIKAGEEILEWYTKNIYKQII